jgi:hypothetical protein
LEKKGYLTNTNLLTQLALNLLLDLKPVEELKADPVSKFSEWVIGLHGRLQQRVKDLTGKKQKVLGERYSFLCNAKDLEKKLKSVISKHKLVDYTLIERTLLKYVDKCNAAKWQFTTLIEYYIEKNDMSKLVTDMDSFDDKEIKQPVQYDGVNM